MIEQILAEAGKQLPLVGGLIWVVRYLQGKLDKKEHENIELYKLLLAQEKENSKSSRESEKESIQGLNDVTAAMKELNTTLRNGK